MKNHNVISLEKPVEDEDFLTTLLRQGAKDLISKAVQAELAGFLAEYQDAVDEQRRQSVVRNGYLPAREIMTGIGTVDIKVPKTRDKSGQDILFRSELLPPYIKRTKSIETLLPWLYLKGISTGDFSEALAALLGKDAEGVSPGTISRLKQVWGQEHDVWRKRDLSGEKYVYIWADGVYTLNILSNCSSATDCNSVREAHSLAWWPTVSTSLISFSASTVIRKVLCDSCLYCCMFPL
jgi:transposase-like protein|tara:strand:- start:1001 stop:1711 length:711 start_codon:yes stop_codon:yes gene_type:complete